MNTYNNNKKNDKRQTPFDANEPRMLPCAPEVERAVIGAIILESSCIFEVGTRLRPELFTDLACRLVCEAVLDMYAQGIGIDLLTVVEQLQRNGTLEQAGGPYGVTTLFSSVDSSSHIMFHVGILTDKYLQRQLILFGMGVMQSGYDNTMDVGDTLEETESKLSNILNNIYGQVPGKLAREFTSEALTQYLQREECFRSGIPIGIPSNFKSLDAMLGGWMNGQLYIVAARPSMGKSIFALTFARNAAELGYGVAFFSIEMGGVSLIDRLSLMACNVNADDLRSGSLSRRERENLDAEHRKIEKLPLHIDESSMLNIRDIRARVSTLVRKGQCNLVVIDYLQLMAVAEGGRESNREQQVAAISRQVKLLAKECNIPVILLSQMSRAIDKREHHRPNLSDLRESGAIEQDADVVCFIHRENYYEPNAPEGEGKFIVCKNRVGPTGEFKFYYNETFSVLSDYNINAQPTDSQLRVF